MFQSVRCPLAISLAALSEPRIRTELADQGISAEARSLFGFFGNPRSIQLPELRYCGGA